MTRMVYSVGIGHMPKCDIKRVQALKGRHPRVHGFDIRNVESLDVPVFVIVCDAAKSVSITHGKNGVPALPAVKDSRTRA
jgi:hypothetical protein